MTVRYNTNYGPWRCSSCSCCCGILLCCCCCLLEMKTNMQSERRRKEPNKRTSSPMPGTKSSAILGVCNQSSDVNFNTPSQFKKLWSLHEHKFLGKRHIGEIYVWRCLFMTVQVHFFEYPCFLRSNEVLLQLATKISNRSAPPTCDMGVVVVPRPSARLPAKGLEGGVWDEIMGVVTFYSYTCLPV